MCALVRVASCGVVIAAIEWNAGKITSGLVFITGVWLAIDKISPLSLPLSSSLSLSLSVSFSLSLTGFECRCGHLFCAMHRYADKHSCTFDYKTAGRKELEVKNPKVVAAKVQKI